MNKGDNKMNTIEQLKEKLIELANTAKLVRITILDSKGDENRHTGRIYLSPDNGAGFNLFETNCIDMPFKAEDIIRLSVMTDVWSKE